MSPPGDHWWTLPTDATELALSALIDDVVWNLKDVLVPDIRAHLSDLDLRDYWITRWMAQTASYEEIGFLLQLASVTGPQEILKPLQRLIDDSPSVLIGPDQRLTEVLRAFGYRVIAVSGTDT